MLDRNHRMRYAQGNAQRHRCEHGGCGGTSVDGPSCSLCGRPSFSCKGGKDRYDSMLMQKLRKVDFSLTDVILYLDAYPDCAEAMQRYRELQCERDRLLRQLAENGYPLSPQSVVGDFRSWTDGPWPWEPSANV